jgi:Ni,Fe-hydrogenase III component G
MDAEGLLAVLELAADVAADVERNAGGTWVRPRQLDVRAMATRLHENEARLVTISARPDGESGFRIVYHWDTGSGLLHVSTVVPPGGSPATIADLLPGADWAEREIRDYYDLTFAGRASTPALMLRAADPAGLFTRTGDLGRDTDPARTARAASDGAAREEGEPR